MHKIYTLLLAGLLSSISAYASNAVDSIGVENNKGKKVIIYKVEAKETYYSISKKYNISYKDLMEFNDSQFLQIGVTLKVPTNLPFNGSAANNVSTTPTTTVTASSSNATIIEYTIKAKDNLNMLAEKYGTTVNEIKSLNNLTSINLQIGQVLKIPNGSNIIDEQPATVNNSALYPPKKKKTTAVKAAEPIVEETAAATHVVKAKENLNLIAQKYNTTVDEIKSLNGLTSNNLRIGQVLKVAGTADEVATTEKVVETPVVEPKVKEKVIYEKKAEPKPAITVNSSNGDIEHTVLPSETIYSIAKKYGATTYQITTSNNLKSNDLKVGQKLIIKNAKPVGVNEVEDEEEGTSEATGNTIKDPALKGNPGRYGLTQVEEKGTAVWIEDKDLDPTKMLILHRTVPVGTVIKITNPMTNRSTFAKVVGKFTENETTKDVIIVMTKAVADAVGALDKRFFCNINYGALENEQ